MVVGENKRTNIMDGIENTGDVRLHDHRLRLKQRFDIVRKLGQGTYGKVQLGINKKTGQEVAIKTIKKCKIESEADLVRIRREVQIMSSVRHPNIVHIYEVFENSEKMILVMEYCSGGELYDYLSQKKVLQEDEARRLFRQIATAVYYCHIHKICHRDLKLENVLLDDTGSAKIADFGLSNVFKETSLLSTFCGSPLYASPEIVKGTPYIGPEVDCWSLGVLLYTLVYGAMPFDGSNFKRLVRQISNGDYYEPKAPSSASPLIRDMLTVDPLKRADIVYICDHPWVNTGCETSCLEMSEALAAETPVRLDLLLSLAPAAPSNSNSVMMPNTEAELGPEESCADISNSASMAVEPSNSAEKRILDLVAEGGEDAIKPSPTRTIVSAGDNKRKLELAMSASGLQRKKERVASSARLANSATRDIVPEEASPDAPPPLPAEPPPEFTPPVPEDGADLVQPTLKSSATMTISPAPTKAPSPPVEELPEPPKETPKEPKEKPAAVKPRVTVKKKIVTQKSQEEKAAEKQEEAKPEESKPTVALATDKLTSLSLGQPAAAAPAKKKFSLGGSVGSFKEQFERRASLTNPPEVKRTVTKPVVSKIAKPKAQSEDRDIPFKTTPETSSVRLQQIGIEPSPVTAEGMNAGGVKKTESEPSHSTTTVDPTVLLHDARRSLQNSMAKLVEEKTGEDSRRRAAARDIISSAIRTGKPPVPYGRSSSAGVTSLSSPPGTPPAPAHAPPTPRVFRTEAQHRVEDHRTNSRGASVERIIPIHVSEETPAAAAPAPVTRPVAAPVPAPGPSPAARPTPVSLRRLVSSESGTSESSPACSSPGGEPIKKSAREFIIPIAVEGKGYVTPRQGSLEPEGALAARPHGRLHKPRRISSLVSGGESEEEDDSHMHRLRSSRAARAESVSSGEEDEEDEGFHLLTAENLFSTLLHRVRALTNRLNGEEGPGFPAHPHSLFNNLQSPFFQHSPHLSRRHNALREGWGSRDLHTDFDSMFNKSRPSFPRGSSKKSSKHQTKAPQTAEANAESGLDLSDLDLSSIQFSEKEMAALSGLTPALSRRLQKQLLAHLPPAAARTLRRTLSLQGADRSGPKCVRSHSATKSLQTDSSAENSRHDESLTSADHTDRSDPLSPDKPDSHSPDPAKLPKKTDSPVSRDDSLDVPIPQFSTLPRLKRHSTLSRETTPPASSSDIGYDKTKLGLKESSNSRNSSVRSTPDRPLLSKYLTPDRTVSLDESFSSDSGSILSEPSYIAAYGQPGAGSTFGGFRRHSMRATPSDQPRKRISRFLRPDFFDTPPDESQYAKLKKEKELETQKVLKEIREKKNKPYDPNASVRSPVETSDVPLFKDDANYARKGLSALGLLTAKERSRSNTPFFPILDNIKETILDTSMKNHDTNSYDKYNTTKVNLDDVGSKESKLTRPKSYPVKNLNSIDRGEKDTYENDSQDKQNEVKEKAVHKESKLIRPKSYPTSSPSPEKVYVSRTVKKEQETKAAANSQKTEVLSPESATDVEVSFSISLPKKTKPLQKAESLDKSESNSESASDALILKKYQVVGRSESQDKVVAKSESKTEVKKDAVEKKQSNGTVIGNGSTLVDDNKANIVEETKIKVINHESKKEDVKLKTTDAEGGEKKTTIKKRIIKKVSSKSKADMVSQDGTETKLPVEKKKVTKKLKEKTADGETKSSTTVKKKSVLQTIGHKIEKFTSNKSSSPDKDKVIENKSVANDVKKESPVKESKLSKTQRENSVPADIEPTTESNLVKRAVTLTDVAALESPASVTNKTTVSKVLGLFKKFDTKEKVPKPTVEKSPSDNIDAQIETNSRKETVSETDLLYDNDKPKRPTSLLLNGLGRKNKYGRTSSDSVSVSSLNNDEQKKENDSKRNSLKLDFSRLPRVKKIVPTNPVIEPQYSYSDIKPTEGKNGIDKNGSISDGVDNNISSIHERSRSRSRSTFSNADIKPDHVVTIKVSDEPTQSEIPHPHRERTPTTPEKEDIVERIRRKSFYSRFNEKKARRKSSLVGPGAAEYDPLARLHGQASEPKYDMSPTSPLSYDLSPGFSGASDLSPSTERYRSLMTDLPVSPRSALRFDNYGLNDKVDSYRSLDRNEFRKHPGSRSYLDYDQPSSYGANRYARTMSLMDSSDGTEDPSLAQIRDPHKYNRTISMYSPGSYATYRPKRTRNSAIILKESEKEPSPENILEKIRQRKTISISVTRKPDPEKTPTDRSPVTPKGEGDSAECPEKVD